MNCDGFHSYDLAQYLFAIILQEVLLRRCISALHAWRRLAATERRRSSLLLQHLASTQQAKQARSSFAAWRQLVEGPKTEAAFIMHSLPPADKGLMQAAVRAWAAHAAHTRRLQVFRQVHTINKVHPMNSCLLSKATEPGQD